MNLYIYIYIYIYIYSVYYTTLSIQPLTYPFHKAGEFGYICILLYNHHLLYPITIINVHVPRQIREILPLSIRHCKSIMQTGSLKPGSQYDAAGSVACTSTAIASR